jgi:hypothetical protein
MSARDRKVYVVCVSLGLAVAVLAMLRELQLYHEFRREAALLAPGTEIRPLGLALQQMIPELGGIALVSCCVVPATILGWRGRSWLRVVLALLILTLSLVPIVVGPPAFRLVVEERGLVLKE